jgi:rhodanese-related sulfurtransferase
MKSPTLAALAVAASFIATAAIAQSSQPNAAAKAPAFRAHVLKRPEVDALLAHPEKLLVIDVRRPDELSSIGGFPVYLSIQLNDLKKSLAWIPRDRTVVTVSNHAGRGGRAADFLTDHGFKVAGTIGVQNYEAEGGKLTRIAQPVAKAAAASATSDH